MSFETKKDPFEFPKNCVTLKLVNLIFWHSIVADLIYLRYIYFIKTRKYILKEKNVNSTKLFYVKGNFESNETTLCTIIIRSWTKILFLSNRKDFSSKNQLIQKRQIFEKSPKKFSHHI